MLHAQDGHFKVLDLVLPSATDATRLRYCKSTSLARSHDRSGSATERRSTRVQLTAGERFGVRQDLAAISFAPQSLAGTWWFAASESSRAAACRSLAAFTRVSRLEARVAHRRAHARREKRRWRAQHL